MKINGKRLKLEMQNRKIPLEVLSKEINISIFSISKWRKEKVEITQKNLAKLAKAFHLSEAAFVKNSKKVNIIRCKDCKHYKNKTCYETIIPCPQPDEYWFCAGAERKNDA